ncbi:MAG TPA: DNA alkylation repair protein [Candidatus Eisenbacteria bacterium]|nr:DNA alkylation repair protein [Candidatus Eisenbacteria bacterium]
MTLEQVLALLETMGLAENRELYAKHGIAGASYGVAFGHLRDLAKRAGTSASLADSLWATGNHDARILATLVVGERGVTQARMRAWAGTLDNAVIADLFARWAWHARAARALSAEWIASPVEWTARAGWMIRALHAIERADIPDAAFAKDLEVIEREIGGASNRVRDAMNMALIAIGIGRASLTEEALEAARRIGRVEVDYGESGGTLAPAEAAIREGIEQRGRRDAGRAGGKKSARAKRAAKEKRG